MAHSWMRRVRALARSGLEPALEPWRINNWHLQPRDIGPGLIGSAIDTPHNYASAGIGEAGNGGRKAFAIAWLEVAPITVASRAFELEVQILRRPVLDDVVDGLLSSVDND